MVYEAKLHNPSHSTFEALAVQHAVGTVMESWTLPLTKTGCRHLQHVINLLSILLRCNGFTRIQKAVMDRMGSRPPNSDHNLFFFFGVSLALRNALDLLPHPTTELAITSVCQIKSTFCCTSQSNREMVCFCIE